MAIPLLRDFDIRGKSVLVREDLNVPLEDGRVANGARIDAALPTVRHCMAAGARVVVVSHLGRPRPGERDPALSLAPVAKALGDALGCAVPLVDDWKGRRRRCSGRCRSAREYPVRGWGDGERSGACTTTCGPCDVFVMDAFGTAHRAHASTVGVAQTASAACAGPLLAAELSALGRVLDDPARPLVAVVGGAKVSTKLAVLEALAGVADSIVVGGGIANTFLLASEMRIGSSLAEPDQVDVARRIMSRVDVPMPVDLMTATAMDPRLPARLRLRDEVGSNEMVLDVGPETARRLSDIVAEAGTVLWNGPLGVFEWDQFGEGTRVLAEAIAAADAYSVAGGGDTLAAIAKYRVDEGISYQSTGGGAFLEYLAGETLPGRSRTRGAHRWAASQMIEKLKELLPPHRVTTAKHDLDNWGRDWTRNFVVAPSAVVFPETVEEVTAITRLANAEGFALVPSGGRTGLSAGAVASHGEVVVSFDRMNRILDFNEADRIVRCEAGVVTANVHAFALDRGLFYPVDFASSGSSQIGGNVATNAGGIKVIRYGMTRDWIAGIKVVTGAGEVLELNRGLVKNATGYDLRHLFIGSEGTLGFVVEADLRLAEPPEPSRVMVLGVDRMQDILSVLTRFQADVALSAFEFFSELAVDRVTRHRSLARPLASSSAFYALLEFDANAESAALAAFEESLASGWVSDGVMSQSDAQALALWALREGITESIAPETPYKNDLAVRVSDVPGFLDDVDRAVGPHLSRAGNLLVRPHRRRQRAPQYPQTAGTHPGGFLRTLRCHEPRVVRTGRSPRREHLRRAWRGHAQAGLPRVLA